MITKAKVLSCLVAIGILTSMMPVSAFTSVDEPILTKIHLQDATFEYHTNQCLTAKLVDENDVPLSGKEMWFYQEATDGWDELGYSVTNEKGIAEHDLFVEMKNGNYSFKSVFEGCENYSPSFDVAEITVIENINFGPVILSLILLLNQIAIFIQPIVYMNDIERASERLAKYREDIIKEYDTWGNRAEGAPENGYPDEYEVTKRKIMFYESMIITSVIGGIIWYEKKGPRGESYSSYTEQKKVIEDLKLGLALITQGEEWWNDLSKSSEDRKRGAQMYVVGADLVSVIFYKFEDYLEIKKLCEIPGDIFDFSVDFHINAIAGKGIYKPGEKIKTTINIANNMNQKVDVWIGASFKDKNGAIYDMSGENIAPKQNVQMGPKEMKKFTIEWTIPSGATVGPYELAVNCWTDDTFTDKYTDDFDWKTLFYNPEFHITSSEIEYYQPFEKVTITIDVENLGEDKNIWFDATLLDPHSELQYPDITPNPDNVLIQSGETKKFKAEWTIPQDAPLGEYSLFINCYKEALSPDVCPPAYADDFDSKMAFYCYNLEIITPTSSSPEVVGDPNNPTGFPAKVSTGIPIDLNIPGIFSAKVNDKTAEVTVASSPYDSVNGIYLLQISPPNQDNEGQYDLNIAMDIGNGISDCDIESNAVIYSTGANADIMLIMDRSGSMTYEISPTDPRTRMSQAKVAAKSFVDTSIKNEDQVGGVDFAGETNLFLPLTLVQSQSDKDFIVNKIENVNVGDWTGTNIGGPMLDAYNELNSERGIGGNAKASILLTDGSHNTGTHPDDVTPYYKNKNWPVHTIGFGAGEEFDEELLIKIASETGGTYHHAPSTAELQDIYNSIGGTIRGEQVVASTTGTIHPEQSVLEEVCIDPSVREASFTVNWEGSDIDLVLNRPDGSIVNELVASTDPDITYIEASTYEVYNVNNPSSGKWTMHLTAIDVPSGGEKYNTRVLSATNLTVHVYTDKEEYSPNEPIKIITTLTKAGNPITRADVNATIERPDSVKEHLLLYDDGKHNDGVALDGVYANYYTNTDVSGSYTIDVYASGKTGPDEFTREVTKSVYVSDTPAGELSVTPASWAIGTIPCGEDVISAFRVSSASAVEETVTVSATDLTDGQGNVIGSENLISMPSTFVVPAGESGVFYERIYVPATARAGNYTGSIVLASTANSVNIPVTLNISKSGYVSIKNANAAAGVSTTTQITISDMTNFGAATVALYYDPTVVHITRVTAGDVGNPIANINNTAGTTTIVAYVSTVTGPDSPTTFANLELLAVGSSGDMSPLTLAVTTLADANGTSVPATTSNGVFFVGMGAVKGDLNHDNHITPADAAIALKLAATGGWDPAADIDGDSRITSLDALMILQAAADAIEL